MHPAIIYDDMERISRFHRQRCVKPRENQEGKVLISRQAIFGESSIGPKFMTENFTFVFNSQKLTSEDTLQVLATTTRVHYSSSISNFNLCWNHDFYDSVGRYVICQRMSESKGRISVNFLDICSYLRVEEELLLRSKKLILSVNDLVNDKVN